MKNICDKHSLLSASEGVIRVPLMIKGRIVPPPDVSAEKVRTAFDGKAEDVTYAKLDGAQVVREPVIDRETMKATGEYLYQLMPPFSPPDVIETDIENW